MNKLPIIKMLTFLKVYWIVFTLSILAVITALSLWPLENLPVVSGADKTHHFIAYSALMFFTALRKPEHWKLIGLFFVAYGGLIELLQPYMNRYFDWLDIIANTLGIIFSLLVAKLIFYFSSDSLDCH